jgi:hypothetical protein
MEAYSEYNELLKGEEHSLNKFDDSMCKNIKMEDFYMKFHKIKSEFRCERLLILYMLDQIIHIPTVNILNIP